MGPSPFKLYGLNSMWFFRMYNRFFLVYHTDISEASGHSMNQDALKAHVCACIYLIVCRL